MEYLLKSVAIIAIISIFYRLFLQKETFFNSLRVYFIVGLILAIFIPILEIPIYIIEKLPEIIVPKATVIENFANNKPFLNNEVKTNNLPIKEAVNWLLIFTNIYLAGFLIFFIKFLIEIFSLSRLLIISKKIKVNGINFIELSKKINPFSVFNYIIYPKNKYNKFELNQIIKHEKVHVSQKHTIDLILVHLLVILQWFNPFAWLLKKDIVQNLEFLADKYATNKTDQLKEYQYLLLKTSLNKNPFALSTNFYNSLIKKRIIMLQKKPSKKFKQLKYVLLLPLFSLFIYAFNTKEIIKTENEILFPNIVSVSENSNISKPSLPSDNKNKSLNKKQDLNFSNPLAKKHMNTISSGFGNKLQKNSKIQKFHKGIDIAVPKNTNVFATKSGVILKAEYHNKKGNFIQIAHKNNYQTNYHHLEKINVTKGETVLVGKVIGTVGSTGKSKRSHLHYEVVKKNKHINPQPFVNLNRHVAKKSNDKIKTIITKNSSDKKLDEIKKELNKQGVIIHFEKVVRNDKNEIIAIAIKALKNDAKVNYHSANDDGINKIIIKVKDNNITIGDLNGHANHIMHNDHDNIFVYSDSKHKHKEHGVHKSNHKHNIISITKNKGNLNNTDLFVYADDDEKITYIINGKKMSKEEYQKMDKNDIKTIKIESDGVLIGHSTNKNAQHSLFALSDNHNDLTKSKTHFHNLNGNNSSSIKYKKATYYYSITNNKTTFYNKFGDEVSFKLSKNLLKQLKKKLK